jgi:hypothetical protein
MNRVFRAFSAVCLPLFAFGGKTGFVEKDWQNTEELRIILIGDTGQIPVEGDPHKMSEAQRTQLRESLSNENATAIVDLGDLFYWKGPKCRAGATPEQSGSLLDAHLYDHVGGLDAPVFLVLGNHDVGPLAEHFKKALTGGRSGKRSEARERCYRLQEELHDDMVFPGESYGVDFGPLRMAALHTSAPQKQWAGEEIQAYFDEDPSDWTLLAGHHVLRTGCDKINEDAVSPWLEKTGLRPDMYANGHAHILQLGVFDGVPAVTSGSGSKLREFPACTPTDTEGVQWGESKYGYAVLEVEKDFLRVRFKDLGGIELHCWQRGRNDPLGEAC